MPNKIALADLVMQWLHDNDYKFEYEDYSDFILLYVNSPTAMHHSHSRLTLGRGSWATSLFSDFGEKRGIMVLRNKVQIGLPAGGVEEIQAWDPSLFMRLKEYLA